MNSVGVIGLGNWGTALANHLAWKGLKVTGWAIEPDIVAGITSVHQNPRYLTGIELSPELRATSDLTALRDCQALVLTVPAKVLASVLAQLQVPRSTLVVSAVKGLDFMTRMTPLQLAGQALQGHSRLATLSGPSFARDIVRRLPCGVVAASSDPESAQQTAELFNSDCMRVYTSQDPLGVELGGILKNVIAIAAGVCDALQLGDSARAGLVTRGLAEMTRLGVAMGADARTFSGLSGLGDLSMTATSDASRNRQVGLRLGRGEKLAEIEKALGSVAEGVHTTPIVCDLAEKYGVEMPITQQVSKLLKGEVTPVESIRALIVRPIKAEVG
jgi:glycerol-3-phosphate dehydrogenase (NAD(P)+)